MNFDSLQNLVVQGESDKLEFKATTGQRSEAARTVCAMLNGTGGFVIFGVTNSGEITGQDCSTRTYEDIAHELNKLEPPAFPDVENIPLETGKTVIVLRVNSGGGPYTFDGRPFMRQGPTTVRMPQSRYERLILERMHGSHRWENQPADGLQTSDLDEKEIILTIEEAIRRGRMEDPNTRNLTELLTGLVLIHEEKLLNAAVVLFARADSLMPRYPQCLLRMARFRGNNITEFLDNRQEPGHAFNLLQRAQRFLRDHLPVAGRIVPNLFERIDDPLYPLAALREALANAFCHRDYSIAGGAVSIAIFDDRLEISSTGNLPFDLTPEDLTRPHRSRPWNPIIAQTFYWRGITEQWGRGTLKMVELTSEAGLVAPEFEVRSGETIVRFLPVSYIAPTRISRDLSNLQQNLLTVLSRISPASLSEIRQYLPLDYPKRTIQDNLQVLKILELIDSNGHGAGAKWILK
jgi:ATP-dependent DNA helicase RecG